MLTEDIEQKRSLLNTSVKNVSCDNLKSNYSEAGLFSQEMFTNIKLLFKAAIPTSLTYLANIITGLICLRFVGKYAGSAELAGASLGNTWGNVFCIGFLFSINQGFSVIAAQLFGAGKSREIGVLYQKNLCILTLVAIPLISSMWYADKVLLSLGLNPDVSINTGIYLRHIVPSLISMYIFDCTKFFLISQEYFYIQGIIQLATGIVHYGWCYLFVVKLNMPVAGAGLAKSVTDLSSALLLIAYIQFSGICKDSWIPWTRECLQKWISYLRQTFIIGANLYVEWIIYEVSVFIVGMLNDEYVLGAHGIALLLTVAFFTLPLGNSAAMQAFVGNAVGEGSKRRARDFMRAGLTLNFIFTSLNVLAMIFFNYQLATFFTNDKYIKDIIRTMLYIYAIIHMADTFSNHLSGIYRTVGGEDFVLSSFVICYIIVGLNCQWIFGIFFNLGYVAIWSSIGLGMHLMCIIMILKIYHLNWDKEILKIRGRVEGMINEDQKGHKLMEMKVLSSEGRQNTI